MEIVEPDAGSVGVWAEMRLALWPDEPLDELRQEAAEFLTSGALDGRVHGVFLAFKPAGDLGREALGLIEVGLAGAPEDRRAHIEAWFVDPEARRRGVGRRLMDRAERWARERGCRVLSSDTTPEYPDSPAAHAALGFVARPGEGGAMLFEKALQDRSGGAGNRG